MSEQNYALQTEIVRYETTQSDFNSPINKEEKRLIDMMYAFDDETSREVTPQKITEGAHHSQRIDNVYDSYFNHENTEFNGIDEDSPQKSIFKKKTASIINQNNITISQTDEMGLLGNIHTGTNKNKVDLYKYKIDTNEHLPQQQMNYNNKSSNNNDEEEDNPLTNSIIESIKPRNIQGVNTVLPNHHNIKGVLDGTLNGNKELECETQKLDFQKSLYTKNIIHNDLTNINNNINNNKVHNKNNLNINTNFKNISQLQLTTSQSPQQNPLKKKTPIKSYASCSNMLINDNIAQTTNTHHVHYSEVESPSNNKNTNTIKCNSPYKVARARRKKSIDLQFHRNHNASFDYNYNNGNESPQIKPSLKKKHYHNKSMCQFNGDIALDDGDSFPQNHNNNNIYIQKRINHNVSNVDIQLNTNNKNNEQLSLGMSQDIEIKYLTKLSNLKNENNELKAQIEKLQKEKSELNNKLNSKNKEYSHYKSAYDNVSVEYDILVSKYEEMKNKYVFNENLNEQLQKAQSDNKHKTDMITELKYQIDKLQSELKEQSTLLNDNNNLIRDTKNLYENMKLNYQEMKNQYDLLQLKNQSLSEENFTLKREIILYQSSNDKQSTSTIPTSHRNNYIYNNNNNEHNDIKSNNETLDSNANDNNNKPHHHTFARMRNKSKGYQSNTNNVKYNLDSTSMNNNQQVQSQQQQLIMSPTVNKEPKIKNTITNSRRRQININSQNDSSNVSSLLSFSNHTTNVNTITSPKQEHNNNGVGGNSDRICGNKKQMSQMEIIEKEKQVNEIETEMLNYQQEKNKYIDELSKLPEHPKHKSIILKKKNLELVIENINVKINNYKKELRELQKNLY